MSAFLKSTILTNRDATPPVFTDSFLDGGRLQETKGSVKTSNADSAKSFYRLIQIPSNARVSELKWQAETLGSGCLLDVGVWYPTTVPQGGANFLSASLAGTLISSSIFAALLNPIGGVSPTEITNQSGNYLIPLQETPLWNVLGLSADPEIDFDIGFVTRVATAAAGYVGLTGRYQI